jgi:hypothetical protein
MKQSLKVMKAYFTEIQFVTLISLKSVMNSYMFVWFFLVILPLTMGL